MSADVDIGRLYHPPSHGITTLYFPPSPFALPHNSGERVLSAKLTGASHSTHVRLMMDDVSYRLPRTTHNEQLDKGCCHRCLCHRSLVALMYVTCFMYNRPSPPHDQGLPCDKVSTTGAGGVDCDTFQSILFLFHFLFLCLVNRILFGKGFQGGTISVDDLNFCI